MPQLPVPWSKILASGHAAECLCLLISLNIGPQLQTPPSSWWPLRFAHGDGLTNSPLLVAIRFLP